MMGLRLALFDEEVVSDVVPRIQRRCKLLSEHLHTRE